MEASKVITARVPMPVYNHLKEYTRMRGISVNKFIQEGLCETNPDMFKPEKIKVSGEVKKQLISAGGGSLVGILVYKSIKAGLQNSKMALDDSEIEVYSYTGALACAVLAMIGITKLLND